MVGYEINNRGRRKCLYCDHPTYKTDSGILNHLNTRHELEYKLALKDEQIEHYKNRKPKIEVREKIVYRDPPAKKEPEYWYIENGGGIYCETCKIVQMRVGIPRGQTIENTPHGQCGNSNLKLVLEVR